VRLERSAFDVDFAAARTSWFHDQPRYEGAEMPKMIFVNLPVTDLSAAIAFYRALGFEQNMQFSDDTGACMVWSEAIYAMLLTHAKWRTFTQRPIPPSGSSEVMLALALDNREAVDAMNKAAAATGGKADVNPVQDLGFMYNRCLADPDGHVWEAFWMDPKAIPSN
jgi:predicted lactoylglutathione lyase